VRDLEALPLIWCESGQVREPLWNVC
jgi:hypothetical protein